MRHFTFATSILLALTACNGVPGMGDPDAPKTPHEKFVKEFSAETVPAWTRWKDAAWRTHTQVVPGDYTKPQSALAGYEAWRAAVSDPKWVRASRDLARGEGPAPTKAERAAVDAVSRFGRLYPANEVELLRRIDSKVGLQARFRRRAAPRLSGETVHPEELARRFSTATETQERKRVWRAMLGPAADLKPGYAELRDLRNEVARKGGWPNHMDATMEPYGMTAAEMVGFLEGVELALRPLYQELHTWAREELAARYDVVPPDLIPAHWLPSPVGDDWGGLAVVENLDVEPALQEMGAKQMVRQVETFYTGTGLPPLPGTLWERSSLYPVPPGSRIGKTQGSSTWDIDLAGDIRILMNARPSAAWMSASYRELAFAHAYALRTDDGVPIPVRMQPPRAVLGSLGVWADLAATRPKNLIDSGLVTSAPDPMAVLLKEALTYVPFVQFGAGTIVPFEYEVYAEGLAPGQMNSRFWGLLARHQGIFPPETRTERWADFLVVEAMDEAPGRYADHVLAVVLAFQLQEAVAGKAGMDPREGVLAGQPAFGTTFQDVAMGAQVEDWRTLMQQTTGAPPSADAMVRYFDPLYRWLQAQNAARTPTLPSLR